MTRYSPLHSAVVTLFDISWYRFLPAPTISYFWLCGWLLNQCGGANMRRTVIKIWMISYGIDITLFFITCWGCIICTYCASCCLGSGFHTPHKLIPQDGVFRLHPASHDIEQLWFLRNYVRFLPAIWDNSCEARNLSLSDGFISKT